MTLPHSSHSFLQRQTHGQQLALPVNSTLQLTRPGIEGGWGGSHAYIRSDEFKFHTEVTVSIVSLSARYGVGSLQGMLWVFEVCYVKSSLMLSRMKRGRMTISAEWGLFPSIVQMLCQSYTKLLVHTVPLVQKWAYRIFVIK